MYYYNLQVRLLFFFFTMFKNIYNVVPIYVVKYCIIFKYLYKLFYFRTQIIDFLKSNGAKNTHQELFHWLYEHFSNRKKTFIPPVYIQHEGNLFVFLKI